MQFLQNRRCNLSDDPRGLPRRTTGEIHDRGAVGSGHDDVTRGRDEIGRAALSRQPESDFVAQQLNCAGLVPIRCHAGTLGHGKGSAPLHVLLLGRREAYVELVLTPHVDDMSAPDLLAELNALNRAAVLTTSSPEPSAHGGG